MAKEDGLLIYLGVVWFIIFVITASLIIYFDFGRLGILIGLLSSIGTMSFLSIAIINKAMEYPVKVYSPIPIKLDKWRFVFYITRGSELISGPDLMLRELSKKG